MGTMGLDDFRTEVRYMLDNRQADSGGPTDAQIDRYINWAYNHVSRPNVYRHRELQAPQNVTLATDDRDYALSPVPHAVYDVYNSTQGYKLTPKSIRDLDDIPITGARPQRYAVYGNTLFVDPQPTASEGNGDTVVVRYWQSPTILSGTNTTVLRDEWDDVIVSGAAWRGWAALSQPERAFFFRDEFAAKILDVQNILKVEGEDTGWQWEVDLTPYQRDDF
jgi:hypothetical protein